MAAGGATRLPPGMATTVPAFRALVPRWRSIDPGPVVTSRPVTALPAVVGLVIFPLLVFLAEFPVAIVRALAGHTEPERPHDERTGRPLDDEGHEAVESLDDDELEAELTIAAAPPNGRRRARYDLLLREKARREKSG